MWEFSDYLLLTIFLIWMIVISEGLTVNLIHILLREALED